MLDSLRKGPFLLAVILAVITLLVEIASPWLGTPSTPGFGIPYLKLVDGFLVLTLLLMTASLLLGDRIQGRTQGIVTLVVALVMLGLSFRGILAALVELIIMLVLLAAVPFGPGIYMGIYGDFDLSNARMLLALTWLLKLGTVICLVLAQQRFPTQIGLLLLLVTSIVLNLVITFLHGLVPRPLVSVTDAIGGIVNGIVGLIWAIVFLIISIIAVIRAIRLGTRRQQDA